MIFVRKNIELFIGERILEIGRGEKKYKSYWEEVSVCFEEFGRRRWELRIVVFKCKRWNKFFFGILKGVFSKDLNGFLRCV